MSELNEPIVPRCKCGNELPAEPGHAAEHPGECCDCFDVGWGVPPPVKLGNETRASLFDHDRYDDDFDKD